MPATALVDFYFDVVSPWSYIASEVLLRYEKVWDLQITYHPVFLGGIMHASGNKPPATLPAKASYGMLDIMRSSKYFEVPIGMPEVFPINTIHCQRFLEAMKQNGKSSEIPSVSKCFWQAYWGGKGIQIGTPEGMKIALASSSLSTEEIEKYLELSSSISIKESLKKTTQEAVDLGAFGAPWIVIQAPHTSSKEVFFGSDRFHLIAQLVRSRLVCDSNMYDVASSMK